MKDAVDAKLIVNGVEAGIEIAPGRRLSQALREDLGLRGTKVGCDAGDCGACTVLIDGSPVCACLTPAAQAVGRDVRTVESFENGVLDNLQQSFLRHGAAQCGICTPGMLVAASALLTRKPVPTRTEVEDVDPNAAVGLGLLLLVAALAWSYYNSPDSLTSLLSSFQSSRT